MGRTAMTWEQKLRRRKQMRKFKEEESAKRQELRPLRNMVNKALKDTEIKKSRTHYSSRVKGWPLSTSEGWESESVIWGMVPHISVSVVSHIGGIGSTYNKDRENEMCAIVEKAFSIFEYEKEGNKFTIFGLKK